MADIKKLKADVKAAERDVANKTNGLKNAAAWSATPPRGEQLKYPEIQKYIADKKAAQLQAEEDLRIAKENLKTVTEIAVAAVEKAKANPTAADIQKAKDEANRRGEISGPVSTGNTSGTGNTGGTQTPDNFAGLLKTASKFIANMKGPDRKALAQQLNDSLGLTLPISELVDPLQLLGAYQSAIAGAQARYSQFKDTPTVQGYLNQKKLETAILTKAGGSSGAANLPYGQIYDKTAAKAKVNDIVKSVLNRDATKEEIADLSAKIIKAQKDNPYRTVNGRTVGGLNVDQFLTDLVQAKPEYASKTQAKQDLTAQGIEATARANGLKLRPEEIKSYADRVKNGEDIKTIESQIRSTASLGQPDTIKKLIQDGTDLETLYSPYKRIMANSLGINPATITLDDPTLRMAIGPDKEMSLYDYQKAIRKDNRWKYSQEANDEVTNMVNQVKRDFGFMG
jgi:DNA-binding transcriptional regulator YhcF (GntR family)